MEVAADKREKERPSLQMRLGRERRVLAAEGEGGGGEAAPVPVSERQVTSERINE